MTATNGRNNSLESKNGNGKVDAFSEVPEVIESNEELDEELEITPVSWQDEDDEEDDDEDEFSWQGLGIRAKATLLALVIGTLPVMAIGGVAYYFSNRSLTEKVIQSEQADATELSDKVNRFMYERYADIQVMAKLPIFTNAQVSQLTTAKEKNKLLDSYVKAYGVYDSIAVFDLNGNVIAQSSGNPLPNHKDRDYFQAALKGGKGILTQPIVSKSSGITAIYAVAPIVDGVTGKTIGVIRARQPVESLRPLVEGFSEERQEEYHLVDASGNIFLATEKEQEGRNAKEDFPNLTSLIEQRQEGATTSIDKIDNAQQLVAYSPFPELEGVAPLNWSAIIAIDEQVAFSSQRQLLLTLLLGTGATAILVGLLAVAIATRATRPILDSTKAVKKLGQGKFDTRIAIQGEDEIAELGSNINLMAEQIQTLLSEQQEAAMREMETQAEIARQQAEAVEQERQRSQQLQQELVKLLSDVEGASRGDLTVRAEISAGEIGIVADFFNSIVESLREVVGQVKQTTAQVNQSLVNDETSMQDLADQSRQQANKIQQLLDSVELMAVSVQEVANNAQTAAEVTRTASVAAETGGEAMDKTVGSIVQLRETVAETAKKVKRLGESSQQISKAVSLINQIALQTNLLAINASIEAARAGEEGRGFAVVAEEVGQLAAQSATATKEIEQIVDAIQKETSEVVQAMEVGTSQVVEGTRMVEQTKQSLGQIVEVSRQIDQLVQLISGATVSQTQTSEAVTNLMKEIAQASESTYTTSNDVSSSLQTTVGIAKKLEEAVGTFKVV